MVDVFLPFPGASAKVVEEQLTKPIERKLSEIKGVEYVYSMSRPGGAIIIVRFYVGEDMERSLVDLYDKLMSNQDVPSGHRTFWSSRGHQRRADRNTDALERPLRRALTNSRNMCENVKKVPGTAEDFVGGRLVNCVFRLSGSYGAYGVTP
jgi:hypothetical protein